MNDTLSDKWSWHFFWIPNREFYHESRKMTPTRDGRLPRNLAGSDKHLRDSPAATTQTEIFDNLDGNFRHLDFLPRQVFYSSDRTREIWVTKNDSNQGWASIKKLFSKIFILMWNLKFLELEPILKSFLFILRQTYRCVFAWVLHHLNIN